MGNCCQSIQAYCYNVVKTYREECGPLTISYMVPVLREGHDNKGPIPVIPVQNANEIKPIIYKDYYEIDQFLAFPLAIFESYDNRSIAMALSFDDPVYETCVLVKEGLVYVRDDGCGPVLSKVNMKTRANVRVVPLYRHMKRINQMTDVISTVAIASELQRQKYQEEEKESLLKRLRQIEEEN
ncbi:uncharacterized protein LOC115884214 [Sitophilus oryzae]|uniref:Uncharacterized protein LOC115884214 n=1 Tax=Sitophilus oryzae TaxID=7048 RepID=A0A6J2Y4H4_SITOR|nr:uncharacterized protein LOC115884214 [Sitophilus oryzae]